MTSGLPLIDLQPFRSVYENGQPLDFMPRTPPLWPNQKQNQMQLISQISMPTQTQILDQWATQALFPRPVQRLTQPISQDHNKGDLQSQLQLPNPYSNYVGFSRQAQYEQNISQIPSEEQIRLQNQMQRHMQMQMQLQRRRQMQQSQQRQQTRAGSTPMITSSPELHMPAPTRPTATLDIATSMLTPFQTQPPTLANQSKSSPKRQRDDTDIQGD